MEIKAVSVEGDYEGKHYSLERNTKCHPLQEEMYTLRIDKEYAVVFNDANELTISTAAWKLALKKPDPHPLYFPLMSLIRALKGNED